MHFFNLLFASALTVTSADFASAQETPSPFSALETQFPLGTNRLDLLPTLYAGGFDIFFSISQPQAVTDTWQLAMTDHQLSATQTAHLAAACGARNCEVIRAIQPQSDANGLPFDFLWLVADFKIVAVINATTATASN